MSYVMARCHPNRRLVRDGRCRECAQVASTPDDDPLPAQIFRTEQRASPMIPLRCSHCGSLWDSDGDFALCPMCGATYHRTSLRIIAQPRTTKAHDELARAGAWRPDRKR